MDRGTWETILTRFQARARGYSVRKEVGRAREDFTDIVQEIDGGLAHLQWRDTVIPIPHFTDTGGLFLRPSSDASRPLDPGLDVRTSPQSPAAALSQERGGDRALLLQKSEAQRDDSGTKGQARLSTDRLPSSHAGGGGVGLGQRDQGGDKEGRATGSSGDSTSLWSSLEQDENFSRSHRGPRQYCLAQEVPRTPEALHLHRNTLTMELVWLQQAIDSRKKYLSLKDRLTVS
ncbi:putative IQ domain-containing protein C [Scophthalmus maximus]|uniref:Putative IQ domain-containing protein C n=1 Tax=Scophthalmus maximus TaxID=52904 RepID=A0A2U9CIS5_SCOMX|nr:IQ domain-containing protein C isoform X1 [Scophthalmus maximus]AWP16397.1 putative IQ domain-containing protein C [Scophthalmus maximus]